MTYNWNCIMFGAVTYSPFHLPCQYTGLGVALLVTCQ